MLFPCRFAAKLFMGGETYKERGKEMKEDDEEHLVCFARANQYEKGHLLS